MNRTGTIEGGAQLTGSLTAISTITGEISGQHYFYRLFLLVYRIRNIQITN